MLTLSLAVPVPRRPYCGVMAGRQRTRVTFSGRMTAMVMACVAGMLMLCLGAILWLTTQRIHDQAQQNALGIARSLAAVPGVRAQVAEQARLEEIDVEALRVGPLQATFEAVRGRTGALFVIVTEDRGLRLAHPSPEEIGRRVSTAPEALSGVEVVATEWGTLGESVRAKVPVYAPGSDRVVGEVSAGVAVSAVTADRRQAALSIVVVGAAGLALAGAAALYLKRRLRRLTLGFEPEEMAASARDQAAVLYGVEDGVIGVRPDGVITVRNKAARVLLDLPHRGEADDVVGRGYSEVGLPAELTAAIDRTLATGEPSSRMRLAVGDASMVASVVPVHRDGVDLGGVVMLKDTTAVENLGSRLDAVETMSSALRAQRHEFANRLHALAGLLDAGQAQAATEYLHQVIDSGPVRDPVPGIETVQDTFLRAFIGAKGVQAREFGVELRVGRETSFWQTVADPQDATVVLGNLVDNAVRAALEAGGEDPWVEVDLLGDADTLHVVVADSGHGVPPTLDIFASGVTTRSDGPEAAHGQGVGLALARRMARQRGGEVWLADPGGAVAGAVFCARLPGVLHTTTEPRGSTHEPDGH